MRIIKLGVISVIVLFVILTLISSLLPSNVLVSRAVDIRSSGSKIKEELFHIQNWQHWMTDDKGQKGIHAYDIKTGSLVIGAAKVQVASVSDTTISTLWMSPGKMTGTFRIIDHHTPDSVLTVQWQMEQKVKWYPWEKFATITKDELWGGSMEKSLENLKALVESR